MVDFMDFMIWRIVRLSGEVMLKEDWMDDSRVVRKCWRTSEDDEPVIKAYAWRASRGCRDSSDRSICFSSTDLDLENRSRRV